MDSLIDAECQRKAISLNQVESELDFGLNNPGLGGRRQTFVSSIYENERYSFSHILAGILQALGKDQTELPFSETGRRQILEGLKKLMPSLGQENKR